MDQKVSLDELRSHYAEVTERIKKLAAEYDGRDFAPDALEEFEALKVERTKTDAAIKDREERQAYLDQLEARDENVEAEPRFSFQTRKASVVPDDPTQLEEYRVRARSLDELERAYKDGAKKILDSRIRSVHPSVSDEEFQDDSHKLIDLDREVALRFIFTQTRGYRDEFAQYCINGLVGPEMQRAASLTTTAGGYAVPVELDTTLMLTNAGAINPIRQLARVRQTNVNTYEFINTTGITAGFGDEATEASDNAPTLAQPTVNLEKAFAFVPMSIEIAQDWANIQSDLALAFADAKGRLESTKFLKGVGHASHEPMGLIAAGGATSIYTTATTAVFAIADLYGLEGQLSPRYRQDPSCAIVGSKKALSTIRQFDTAGGAGMWVQLPNQNPQVLLGYPVYEWSDYDNTISSGSTVLTIGAFNYFGIVDRAGLNVEFIPHLFGGSNRYPTGQRGLYAWWRTSSKLLSPVNTVSTSAFQSLKVL